MQVANPLIGRDMDGNGLSQWEREHPEEHLREGYDEEAHAIARYLRTLTKPVEINTKEFRKFKKEALKFQVYDRHLFRYISKNILLRRVIYEDIMK